MATKRARRGGWKRVRLNTTDVLWSNVVRARDGWRCRWPLCSRSKEAGAQIESAHVISRRFKGTRWVVLNGIALCHVHHRWASEHETEWQAMALRLIGEPEYTRLLILAKGPARRKPDELMLRKMLREELARLEHGSVLAV